MKHLIKQASNWLEVVNSIEDKLSDEYFFANQEMEKRIKAIMDYAQISYIDALLLI